MKALVEAFSVIVKPDGSFAALELSLTNDECRRVILIAAITPPASSQHPGGVFLQTLLNYAVNSVSFLSSVRISTPADHITPG